jgi:hypothetical protein
MGHFLVLFSHPLQVACCASVLILACVANAQPADTAQTSDQGSRPNTSLRVETVSISLALRQGATTDSVRTQALDQARQRAVQAVPSASVLIQELRSDEFSQELTSVWAAVARPRVLAISERREGALRWADFDIEVRVDDSEVDRQVMYLRRRTDLQHQASQQQARAQALASALSPEEIQASALSVDDKRVAMRRAVLDSLRAVPWVHESAEDLLRREQKLSAWRATQPVRRVSRLGMMDDSFDYQRLVPPELLAPNTKLTSEFKVTQDLAQAIANRSAGGAVLQAPSGLVMHTGSLLERAIAQDASSVYFEAFEYNILDPLLNSSVEMELVRSRFEGNNVHVTVAVRVTPPNPRPQRSPSDLFWGLGPLGQHLQFPPPAGTAVLQDTKQSCFRPESTWFGQLTRVVQEQRVTLNIRVGPVQRTFVLAGLSAGGLFCIYTDGHAGRPGKTSEVSFVLEKKDAEAANAVVAKLERTRALE